MNVPGSLLVRMYPLNMYLFKIFLTPRRTPRIKPVGLVEEEKGEFKGEKCNNI